MYDQFKRPTQVHRGPPDGRRQDGPLGFLLDEIKEVPENVFAWVVESGAVEWMIRQLFNLSSTKSMQFFAHYLEGSEKEMKLDPVPIKWQEAIQKNWKKSIKRNVKFKENNKYRVDPYNWGIPDFTAVPLT